VIPKFGAVLVGLAVFRANEGHVRHRVTGVAFIVAAGAVVAALLVTSAGAAPLDRVTELVSTGSRDGGADSADVGFSEALSDNGQVATFETPEPLTPDDGDADNDVYLRSAGTTTLVSTSQMAGGPDSAEANLNELSPDGARVYFETEEPLLGSDGDAHRDVYVWEGGSLTLVSDGPQGGGPDSADAFFAALAGDGQTVVLTTQEPLVAGDPDATIDLYRATPAAAGGFALAHVSDGTNDGGLDAAGASFAGVSHDGQNVFFATDESLEATDGDLHGDLYRRTGASTTLLSGGPLNGGMNSAGVGFFVGGDVSADGLSIGFFTGEPLAGGDVDTQRDLYRGSGGQPRLVSAGTMNFQVDPVAQTAGGFDFFQTAEPLLVADTDTHLDIYAASVGTLRLVSNGPLAGGSDSADVGFGARRSADGARVLFQTPEPLVPEDTDAHVDTYERDGSVTRLISGGPLAGGADSTDTGGLSGALDGSRWFFGTAEPLTSDDTDTEVDYYEHSSGEIRLVTTGPRAGGADAASSSLVDLTPDGSALLFSSAEPLVDLDSDANEDAYLAAPPPPPPPPVAASPPPAGDTTAPVVNGLRVRPTRFRLGRRLPRVARRAPTGTTIRLRLSEAARLRLGFARTRPGRRVRGRCRKPTRRNRGRRRCHRDVRVRGEVSLAGRAGLNRIRFQGRLTGRRSLRPGRYRLRVGATDVAGNRSKPRTARFRLLPRAARR
jgi:hypothetical protein